MPDRGRPTGALCHWCDGLIVEAELSNGRAWYWCRACGSQHAHISYTDSDSGSEVSKFVPLSPIPPEGQQAMSETAASEREGPSRSRRRRRRRWPWRSG